MLKLDHVFLLLAFAQLTKHGPRLETMHYLPEVTSEYLKCPVNSPDGTTDAKKNVYDLF